MAALAPMLLAGLLAAPPQDPDPVRATWLTRIEARHGPGPCAVSVVDERWRSFRNDGLRQALWIVQTCRGRETYRLEYWPREAFPDRADEYEVILLLPEAAGVPTP